MNELILFHQSIDSLSETEYGQFIHGMGRNVITKILFRGLQQGMINNQNNDTRNMNDLIRTIKQARKKNKSTIIAPDDNDSQQITLNDIHEVLLLEISSFLLFFESVQFARTSRSIFIGSHSATLPRYSLSSQQFFSLTKYCDQHSTEAHHLSQQKLFNSLEIDCDDFVKWEPENSSNIILKSRCNKFQLYDDIQHLMITSLDSEHTDFLINHLFETNKFTNLKSLTLDCDTLWLHSGITGKLLIEGVRQFPNLQTFEIYVHGQLDVTMAGINALDTNQSWISRLKGLALIIQTDVTNTHEIPHLCGVLYRSITNKLESLHISDHHQSLDGKLNGLKELCLHLNSNASGALDILLQQQWSNLQRIYLKCKCKQRDRIELWMDKIVRNVDYIAFDITNQHMYYFVVKYLLDSLAKVQKDTFKIRWERLFFDDNSHVVCLDRMVRTLNNNCADWMFIGYHWACEKSKDFLCSTLDGFKSKYNVLYSYNTTAKYCDFAISKKESKINGYHQHWNMTCHCCKQHPLFDTFDS
eukprot:437237_1